MESWFKKKAEMVWTFLFVLVLVLLTVAVAYFTIPGIKLTGLLAFGAGTLASGGIAHLATQSRWRSRSLVVWAVLAHLVILLAVPLLALMIFPGWYIAENERPFQSVPYSFANGLILGLFLLIINSIARLCARWWSSWRYGR
ncbi:hypothetical protein BH24ACT22_BH24ACT22_15620 [soil metagenome]